MAHVARQAGGSKARGPERLHRFDRIMSREAAEPRDKADRLEHGPTAPNEGRSTMTDSAPNLTDVLDARAADLAHLDEAVVFDVVGVLHAAEEMHAALAALEVLLDGRHLREAAALGYRDIASAFVFLQRALGALQGTDNDLSALISDIAGARGCSYEKIEPDVLARMENMRPRPKGEGIAAKLAPTTCLDLPEVVRAHLGIEIGATVRFEPKPDGRVELFVEDRGPRPDFANLAARLRETTEGPDHTPAGAPPARGR